MLLPPLALQLSTNAPTQEISDAPESIADLLSPSHLIACRERLAREGHVRFAVQPSDRSPEEVLSAIVTSFSRPLFWREGEPVVAHVRPVEGKDPHSFQGAAEFALHTDLCWMPDVQTPRYATLLCLRTDPLGGGDSQIVRLANMLGVLNPDDIAALLSTSFEWRSHRDAPIYTERVAPVLFKFNDDIHVRFRRDLILEGEQSALLDRFEAAATSAIESFALQAGECWIVDNQKTLHGRTALRSGIASDRELLRIHSS